MEPNPSAPHRVEAYLDQILAPLAPRLSPFHRDELRRELRTHLWERIDAYQELGHSDEDAVTEALRQFGGAENFLRQWQQGWKKAAPRLTLRDIGAATRPALCLSLCALSLAWFAGHLVAFVVRGVVPTTYLGGLMIVYVDSLFLVMAGLGFGLLPLALGLVVGLRGGKQAGLGMFTALALVVAAGGSLYRFGAGVWPEQSILGGFVTSLPMMAALWMPLACTAAVISGWWIDRRKGVFA